MFILLMYCTVHAVTGRKALEGYYYNIKSLSKTGTFLMNEA